MIRVIQIEPDLSLSSLASNISYMPRDFKLAAPYDMDVMNLAT